MTERTRKKYDADFKQHWVNRYREGGHNFKTLSQEAGVSADSLSDWVKADQARSAPEPTPKKAPAAMPERPAKKASRVIATDVLPQPKKEKIDNDREPLRKALKVALEERDTLKRAMRILFAIQE